MKLSMADSFNIAHVGAALQGPPAPGSSSDNLRLAASRGHVQAVKDLLVTGATFEPDKDGRNALHYAAQEGQAEVCKYLAAHGCDVNMQDVMGYTPLLRAASQGAQESVQMFLDAGCDIDLQDEHGNAAIHETCWNGFSQTAELLVKYNCNVCLTNKAGFTALHLSAQNGHNECSRVLLYAGCNPDMQNNYGDTALHTAARYGHAGVARILISAKCKLSEQNKNGDTALHISAALKRRKIAKILVESGIDTELLNKQNERAVDVARRKEHPEIILIITSYCRPRPSSFHRLKGDNVGVTFKETVDFEDRLDVRPVDESLHKQVPKADKQEKERRFFFFKKKKKEKEKVPITPATSDKNTEVEHVHAGHGKPAVHGFFSQYVPRDGVQLYRDLAGNIKQGPIGYAPVCQCGPSLRRLENSITDTRESLHNHIDASHHILSQRIDHLDTQTKQQAHTTETMVEERFNNERNACHSRISDRLQEERLETQTMFDQKNAGMKEELEYWLNDKLASYGHCLDHHHDDSALPPRNLFFDFPTMGRLVRSRSDETLSASDYSGKFRKKDFYASRQAAMQQIRGWDVPHTASFSNQDRSRKKERNNNVIQNSNKVVTQAQVHSRESDKIRSFSPIIIQTLPGALPTSLNAGTLHSAGQSAGKKENVGIMSRSANMPQKQTTHETPQTYFKKAVAHPRVTFSSDQPGRHVQQPHQHVQEPYQHVQPPYQHAQQPYQHAQQPHQQHAHQPHQQRAQQHLHSGISSPLPLGSQHIVVGPVPLGRQSLRNSTQMTSPNPQNNMLQQMAPATQHSWWSRQNLPEGGPPKTGMKSAELGDSRISSLTGQERNDLRNTKQQNVNTILTRYQNGYDIHYDRQRTLSADSLLNDESHLSFSKDMARCHSVENTLDDSASKNVENYNSGYSTDTALRPSSTKSISKNIDGSRSVRSAHSASPASRTTYRYRLPETSTSPDIAKPNSHALDRSQENTNFQPRHISSHTQSPTNVSTILNKNFDSGRKMVAFKPSDAPRELSYSKTLHKSLYGLSDNTADAPGPGLSTSGMSDLAINSARSDSLSRSDGNLASSKTHSVNFSSPVKECLQHESLVSANTVPSPAYAGGNKEDSTCSSNQDSGYGSRNHPEGLRRGVNTSGGTPSSSFSTERSGCNTPSNADTPYANHGELSNTEAKTFLSNHSSLATVHDNKYMFSSTDLLSKNSLSDGSGTNLPLHRRSSCEKSNSGGLDNFNVNCNSTVPFGNVSLETGMIKSFDSFHQNSSLYNRPVQILSPPPLNMQTKLIPQASNSNRFLNIAYNTAHFPPENQLQFDKIDNVERESERQRPVHHVEVSKRPSFQQNYLNNHAFNERNNNLGFQQAQNEQTYRPSLPHYDGTPSLQQTRSLQGAVSNHSYRPNASQNKVPYGQHQILESTSQAAVQDHIQGWYQRKLMEAAQRLRQSHNYSQQNVDQQDTRNYVDYHPRPDSINRTNEFGGLPYRSQQSHEASSQFISQNKSPATNSQQYGSLFQSHQDQWPQQNSRHDSCQQPSTPMEIFDSQGGTPLYKDGNIRRSSAYESNFISNNNTSHKIPVSQTYHMKAPYSTYPSGMQVMTHNTARYDSVRGSDV